MPKFVNRETTRHGKEVFYFRVHDGQRLRLPPLDHPNFASEYAKAVKDAPLPHVGQMPRASTIFRKQKCEKAIIQSLKSARGRSLRKSLPFDIDRDWLLDKLIEQDFCCAMTGIQFFSAHISKGKKNPFAPSLDRIDPALGYTRANVRIIVFALNAMMLDWGPKVVDQVVNSARIWRTKRMLGVPGQKSASPYPIKIRGKSI